MNNKENANLTCNIKPTLESQTIESMNILTVGAGTNCPKGGDSGHGGLTTIVFENDASTDMRVEVDGKYYGNVDRIVLTFGGDTECDTLIKALSFARDALIKQRAVNWHNIRW